MEKDIIYSRWAIDKIINWDNSNINTPLLHIHGSNDKVFPIKRIKNVSIISGGSHFMLINKGKEIKILIEEFINN